MNMYFGKIFDFSFFIYWSHFPCNYNEWGLFIFIIIIILFFLHVKDTIMAHLRYTILPKVLGRPLLMNRFDYFSNFYEYKS